MFRKSILRLTGGYLLGIMVLSTIFSVVVYRASTRELDLVQHRQQLLYQRGFPSFFPPGSDDPFADERLSLLNEARTHTLIWLLEFNLVVLIVGGGVGYWLAKYTIKPIQRSWESQARFTADASHELRTPLASMQTELEVALRDPDLTSSEAKKLLVSNLEEVSKLTGLSNALLKLNQLQGRQLVLQPVSVSKVIAKAVSRLSKLADKKNMEISTKVDECTIHADEDLLTEAVVVLIDNAIKYGEHETPIIVQAKREHHHLQISVTNSGVGIADEDRDKIFERFYRADASRTKTKVDGFGLGLSLAKDIITAHHGQLIMNSKPNENTTFSIILPL